jgi:hypothetical protein
MAISVLRTCLTRCPTLFTQSCSEEHDCEVKNANGRGSVCCCRTFCARCRDTVYMHCAGGCEDPCCARCCSKQRCFLAPTGMCTPTFGGREEDVCSWCADCLLTRRR